MPIEIIVGLPHLSRGPILARAIHLRLPVLISANSLSRWTKRSGYPEWTGWNLSPLANASGLASVDLDSAGFVAHVAYGGYPWGVDQYFQLVTAVPFRRFASMDYCVEQEIAHDRATVLDRISRTISANRACRQRAADLGILDRLMPVLQGRTPDDYLRCAHELSDSMLVGTVVGVGSMCRRQLHGPEGLIAVLEQLDRHLPAGVTLHCFGVKGQALSRIQHLEHRIASIDSQAYGVAARQHAFKHEIPKTNALVADHMQQWVEQQHQSLAATQTYQIPLCLAAAAPAAKSDFEACIERARAEYRDLIETGELDHDTQIDRWSFETACEIYQSLETTTA